MTNSYLNLIKPTLILLCLAVVMSCQQQETKTSRFKRLSSQTTGIDFNNKIVESDSFNITEYIYIYNGAGVGVIDVNNDGLQDLYFAGNQVDGKLYLNKGEMLFEDITASSHVINDRWVIGVSVVDINADGWDDLYLSTSNFFGPKKAGNLLYINNKDNTFREVSIEYGLADSSFTTQTAFFDYDNDGDLDAFLLCNGVEKFEHNTLRPKKHDGSGVSNDRLYRNNGDNTFTDVTHEAQILTEGYGLGIAITDFNMDGWLDIYCSNDFITNDLIWINNQDGTFSNQVDTYFKHQTYNAMGNDIADFNNDLLADVVAVDMLPATHKGQKKMMGKMNYDKFQMMLGMDYTPQQVRNTLQLNNGDGSYSEIGFLSDMYKTDWSWSPLIVDVDNDGYKELFISNGYPKNIIDKDYITYNALSSYFGTTEVKEKNANENLNKLKGLKLKNYLFENGGELVFEDASEQLGDNPESFSYGAVHVDLDNDGDLDFVTNNINDAAFVYENNSTKTNFIRLALKDEQGRKIYNGAEITVYHQGHRQLYSYSIYRGYASSVEPYVHFGLGNSTAIDSLKIVWADRSIQWVKDLSINQLNEVKKTSIFQEEKPSVRTTLLATADLIEYEHEENYFDEFKYNPLMSRMYSMEGPGVTVGDLNSDGIEDILVPGGAQKPTSVFWGSKGGSFKEDHPFDKQFDKMEDLGLLVFDVDNDGDLDVYASAGSSEFMGAKKNQLNRLYLNDGKGNFEVKVEEEGANTSVVRGADIDADGDIDLFVGGSIIPNRYPEVYESYVLINESGKLIKGDNQWLSEIKDLGIVNDALFTDFDNNGVMDLVVTSEWEEIQFLKNEGSKFVNWTSKAGLAGISGLWRGIQGADFDKDGDTDYIVGNHGLNSKYVASNAEPLTMYASDFDRNGTIDPIICHYIDGVQLPGHSRDAIIDQMNAYRPKLDRYSVYAQAKMDWLLPEEKRSKGMIKSVTTLKSIILENDGSGKFTLKELPTEVQIAPMRSILIIDVNNDGLKDILAAGNDHTVETQTGWYDASNGWTLLNTGQLTFRSIPTVESGFKVPGDARGLISYDNKVIALQNQDKALTFKLNADYKSIRPKANESQALVHYKDSSVEKVELYLSSGYLAQSSRKIQISDHVKQVDFFVLGEKSRTINF